MIKASNVLKYGDKVVIKTKSGDKNTFIGEDKFMYLTIDSEDEDPRGRSMLRAAFTFGT